MAKQNAPEKRQRRERGSIDPDDIIEGAFELAEEVSIDNLSMPLLGKHLGVGVTSIYWYFRKKDDLLNAMTDRALKRYVFATPFLEASDWRETLSRHAHSMRETFLGNPILCDLILIRANLSPKVAQLGSPPIESAVANLVDAGLPLDDAFDTYSAVALHVRGSVVLARLQQKQKAADPESRAYYEHLVITPETTPNLAEGIKRGHSVGAPDDKNFDYGLDCILDHASRLIESNAKVQKKPAAARRGGKTAAAR
ncbi:TetR/AcrR family transcriptional regulator [Williamsia sp.]|uniref:TetR/AcrR family transcriptional regulator n=1 Tax=Williamsia sp. TaxID=1872085 RepID=UPI002F94E0FB